MFSAQVSRISVSVVFIPFMTLHSLSVLLSSFYFCQLGTPWFKSFSINIIKYLSQGIHVQLAPDNLNLLGKSKGFEIARVLSYQEFQAINTGNKKMGWWINASNMHYSKLDKYIVLDTVFKLDWQKRKTKNT